MRHIFNRTVTASLLVMFFVGCLYFGPTNLVQAARPVKGHYTITANAGTMYDRGYIEPPDPPSFLLRHRQTRRPKPVTSACGRWTEYETGNTGFTQGT